MSLTTPPPPPTDRILRAILSTVLAMSCFSVLNAMSKTLTTDHYPVIEVIWARYFFAFVFMLAMFLPRSGWKLFSIRRLDTQITRGLLLFFSSYLYFHGIAYMPLATAASISLSSPIIVTALSPRLLGEQVGPRRWAAVGVGFLGALIVVRPGHEGFDWHVLLIVASTVCSARSNAGNLRVLSSTMKSAMVMPISSSNNPPSSNVHQPCHSYHATAKKMQP